MLKEEGRASIYWDPLLKQDGEAYVSFLHELKSRDMCAFQVEKPLEQVGVFFVVRKDGRLRLILDARRVNQRMYPSPPVRLASAAALNEIIVDDGQELFFLVQDVANCFCNFRIPEWLSQRFGLRGVTAQALGLTSLDGHSLDPQQLIFPVMKVLPMGFSWSVHWAQLTHRFLVDQCDLGAPETCEILDRRPGVDMSKTDVARLLYIDNELFIAKSQAGAAKTRATVDNKLEECSLPVHEIVDGVSVIDTIEFEFDGIRHTCRASASKRWRLRGATPAF